VPRPEVAFAPDRHEDVLNDVVRGAGRGDPRGDGEHEGGVTAIEMAKSTVIAAGELAHEVLVRECLEIGRRRRHEPARFSAFLFRSGRVFQPVRRRRGLHGVDERPFSPPTQARRVDGPRTCAESDQVDREREHGEVQAALVGECKEADFR
jgi:hypothetical protein